MPSASVVEAKAKVVSEVAEKVAGSCAGVIVDYKGISVSDDTAMRKELREAGVDYKVVKNTLIKRAIQGTSVEAMSDVLEGTTAIATSKEDYVAAARILHNYAEKVDSFNIKSGYLDGEVISIEKITELAKLPSRDTLLSMVCSVFNAPIAAFARAVQAIADKGDAAAVEA